MLTGEGYFAPIPRFGITVSGAGTAGANGFYEQEGFHAATSSLSTTRPKYVKEGTTNYYSYIYDASVADTWAIADIPDADYDGEWRSTMFGE